MELSLSGYPCIECQTILPSDDKETQKAKNKKPFLNKRLCILTVFLADKQIIITAHKNYCYDGATIPFGIGKGNMKLLIPALFHDIMCENKELVDCDRHLSTDIFERLLIMCGNPKWKASLMHFFVDNYQKLQKGWK